MRLKRFVSVTLVILGIVTCSVFTTSAHGMNNDAALRFVSDKPSESQQGTFIEDIDDATTSTRVLYNKTSLEPLSASEYLIDSEGMDDLLRVGNRPVYGTRILETLTVGSSIDWQKVDGLWDLVKNVAIFVPGLQYETIVGQFIYSVFTGISPSPSSSVGVHIGCSFNTYVREAQIQLSPGGSWETYYTAYRNDFFKYEYAVVPNPNGPNPPVLTYTKDPGSDPDRIGKSPNFDNLGLLSERAMLLYQNFCPPGWENENNVYFPFEYAR